MRLLLKFNAIVLLTQGVGLAVAGVGSWFWLQNQAMRRVEEQAKFLIEAASSVRDYT